jgi:5-methylcytosine-specific restriction endonuclease McrA
MNLKKIPVLVLNPSFEPITIVNAQRALGLISKGTAHVEVPTSVRIHRVIYLPSVVRLVHLRKHIPWRVPIPSRENIFNRDGKRCAYCGSAWPKVVLELEHVLPRCRGGKSTWENLVAACHACNQKKGDKTPEEANMPLLRRPLPATVHTSRLLLRQLGAEREAWKRFLWHDSSGIGVAVN